MKKCKHHKKGNVMVDTIIAIVIFLLCSSAIISLGMKNSILTKEIKIIKKDMNTIHSLIDLKCKDEMIEYLDTNNSNIAYIDYKDSSVKDLFLDILSNLDVNRPNSNKYISIERQNNNLLLTLYGGLDGKEYSLTKNIKN